MSQLSSPATMIPTTGIDLGTRRSTFWTLGKDGQPVQHGKVPMTRSALRHLLEGEPRRVVIETCGSCRWVAALAKELGHEVIVANSRQLHLIGKSYRKTDERDARLLAELGQVRPDLLRPVQLRGEDCQRVRMLLQARRLLLSQRTQVINFIRGQMRAQGLPLPTCSAKFFGKRCRPLIPEELRDALSPLFDQIDALTAHLVERDKRVEIISRDQFPETTKLRQVKGVGPLLALTFVATLESPERFARSRDVGPFVGLTPRMRDSSNSTPQLGITKAGDRELRSLLVSAATYILGPFGPACDLRRYGDRVRVRNDQASRGKARIAVARKLSVLLHQLWKASAPYDPCHNGSRAS